MKALVMCDVSCAIPSLGVVAKSGETRTVTVEVANQLFKTGKFSLVEFISDEPVPVVEEVDHSQESVETLTRLGPAKALKLKEAGVETLEEIAYSDPEELASETGLKLSEIEKWQIEATLKLANSQEA